MIKVKKNLYRFIRTFLFIAKIIRVIPGIIGNGVILPTEEMLKKSF